MDTAANIICGNTASFSPFIIAEELSTAVTISNISAQPDGNQVIISWSTSFEIDNEGFVILRSESLNGPFTPITKGMIPAVGGAGKATYTFTDASVEQGKTYYYRLQDIDSRGRVTAHQVIPVTVAIAKANENSRETTSREDNTMGTPQQTNVASNQDSIESEYQQPGKSGTWVSVVMEDSEYESAVDKGIPPTLALPHKGGGNEEEDPSTLAHDRGRAGDAEIASHPLGARNDERSFTLHNNEAPYHFTSSSFSVSIEDDKGNIIMVSKVEDTTGTDAQTSSLEFTKELGGDSQVSGHSDRPEGLSLQVKEESGRIVLTWQGRVGVKGFILHRTEKGKEKYTPITNLIPYFGQNDKDTFLYRFTDNSVMPGVKYEYKLETVDTKKNGGMTIGKLKVGK
ncbi:MAG TPA: hypothetical protein DDX84_03925 [Nitrospiraceae bacterium]|nr:hypothetical protein [Nitrospiraceae bacterium]